MPGVRRMYADLMRAARADSNVHVRRELAKHLERLERRLRMLTFRMNSNDTFTTLLQVRLQRKIDHLASERPFTD